MMTVLSMLGPYQQAVQGRLNETVSEQCLELGGRHGGGVITGPKKALTQQTWTESDSLSELNGPN
jgi:hypothetical protein